MISEKYKIQLINEVKQLDKLLNKKFEYESLVKGIVEEDNEILILQFIKNLGIFTRESSLPDIKKKNEEIIETLCKYLGAKKVDDILEELKVSSNIQFEDLLNELNELVGLKIVKQQVYDLISYNKIQQLRVQNGLKKSNKTLHMALVGNPGTAKTTVARIIGKMYKSIGLLTKGHFIEASRTDLIAEYQGQTAIKVKRLINRAKGGVLFIDEAYSLTENNNSDSYGRECLTELTKALEDYRDDLVVIVAGYSDLMEDFFESNPGLKSRFNTVITFEDYSLDELIKVFDYICNQNDYVVDKEALKKVQSLVEIKLKKEESYFSNGRYIRNLFDDIVLNQSKRLASISGGLSKEDLVLITAEDIDTHIK
ncbi:MAG: AAA family ATPase [Bacilli bacterium]